MSLVDFGKRLLESAKLGETEEVRLLMTNGAPFTTDWLGTSPLHMAAEHGHVATAEVLLRAGISRDARTKVDRTPLHVAAQEGHAEIVELLIKHGAEINAKDMLQMTPLHWAVEHGHVPVVSCLLKYNADVHASSKFDKTAMDIAEDNGRTDILKMLQEHIDSSDEKNKEKKQLTTVVPKTPLILPKTDSLPFNIVKTDTVTSPFVKEIRSKIARTHNTNSVTSITISDAMSSAKASVSSPVLLQTNFGDLKSNISKSTGDTKSSSSDSDEGESSDPSCTNVLATLAALAEATAPNATISTQEALHWLEMHGITMLPSDNSTIVASALEGGQTVSLTEAGKLALTLVKEHRNLNNGSSPEVSTSEEGGSFYSALQTKAGTSNQLITIVTDKSQIPSIITAQQPPIFVVSGQGNDVTGDEESPPAKKIKTLFTKQEISAVANGKISAEEERLLLQKELEKIKRQAAEYKAQLLLKEHEAEEYRKQLEQLKNTSGNNNL